MIKNQLYKHRLLFMLLLLSCFMAAGQAGNTVSGIVKDNNGKLLPGVRVSVKETAGFYITKEDGRFAVTATNGNTLIFINPAFYPYELKVSSAKSITVQLAGKFLANTNPYLPPPDADTNGMVKTTYRAGSADILHGTQLQGHVLQSMATVGTNQLITTPAPQFLQALPGRLAGLNVFLFGGAPSIADGQGLGYNVRGRGQTILIDGVQRSYTSIDPEQIESVSVLRDALSTVMFGQRSSNGIILITTKKGDQGTPRISFTAQSAITTPLKLPKVLPAWQYATLRNEAKSYETNPTPYYTQADIDAYKNGTDPYGHPDVDWYSTVLKKNAALSRYNFNVQGSGKTVRYFVDMDYLKEDGLFHTADVNTYNTNSQLKRYLLRSNVGVDITKTTFMQVNMMGRIQQGNQPGNNLTQDIFNNLLTTPRLAYPVFNMNGSLGGNDNYQSSNLWGKTVNAGYSLTDVRDVSVDLQITQRLDVLLKGLSLRVQGSYNNSSTYNTNRSKSFASFFPLSTGAYKQYSTTSEQANTGSVGNRIRVSYMEAALTYDKSFGRHQLNVTLVADKQSTILNGTLPEQYTDFAGRATYNFNEKYFAEAAGSYAGYNRFKPGNRFGFFGAAGIGWNVHREKFIKNNIPQISLLKLRATYGTTGQANAGYYSYIQQYQTTDNYTGNDIAYWWGPNASLERGARENGIANTNLTWEKAKKLNLGFDLGLWKDKLTITGELYYNKFSDLIAIRGRNSVILGIGYPQENIQRQNYQGTDWSLTYQKRIRNFNYFITGNLSVVQSKAVYLDEVKQNYDYQYSTGRQVGILKGYTATGFFGSYDEINNPANAVYGNRTALRPGDIRYQDKNSDGVIDANDIGVIGSGKPTVFYGATFGFNYKGLDMSLLLQGTANRMIYMSGDVEWPFGNNGLNNAYEHNLDRWTPATATTAKLPRVWIGSNANNQLTSSFWVKPANFIRLKNAEIGYTVPARLIQKIGIPSVRVFVNGLNLLTFSKIYDFRDDIDPEAYGSAYPIQRAVNFGINIKL